MTVNPDQAAERLDRQIRNYISSGEISGGEILLLDRERAILHRCYGEQSVKTHAPATEKTLYRMMSMTKLVTSLAAARLIERNELDLDALVSEFLPSFASVRVADDPRYVLKKFSIFKLLLLLPLYSDEKVKTTSLRTPLTVKTLLNHTCGIEEGTVGLLSVQKNQKIYSSLEERAEDYAKGFLSFQPGTKSGYSPVGGMDVLGVILGKAANKTPEQVLRDEVITPLDMPDTGFTPTDPGRVIALTKYRKGRPPVDLTGSKSDLPAAVHAKEGVCDCAGGLYGTVSDFGQIAKMLLHDGTYGSGSYLNPETVLMIRTPCAPEQHMKGQRWGLGFAVRESDDVCPDGCYGWSGAYGTHFLVDPENGLALIFAMNRTNIGGARSYISRELEKRLYDKE